jgi:outer membrane lipoprotein-sorting protein
MWANAKSWCATIAARTSNPLRRLASAAVCASTLAVFAAPAADAIELAALNDAQQANLAKVEQYLNGLDTIQSRFVQANPDGSFSEGTMYLERPGKLRFEYDPPDPYLIIASGDWFMYVDKVLGQPTYLPLEKTPAHFFLRPKFSFSGDLRVTSLQSSDNVIRIELVQASEPEMGQVMLIFTEKPMELRKFRVIDAQGGLTDTTLINPRFGIPLSAKLFEYKEPVRATGSD